MALTILLQLSRDNARLFSTEGLEEHQFFSLICMHCNKKVGAMSYRLHPLQKILRAPLLMLDKIILANKPHVYVVYRKNRYGDRIPHCLVLLPIRKGSESTVFQHTRYTHHCCCRTASVEQPTFQSTWLWTYFRGVLPVTENVLVLFRTPAPRDCFLCVL